MRVFVLGGTGAIGRPAVDALVAAGHDVSALARTTQRAGELEARGARPVEVSMFDLAGLTRALAGHDAVVNLASSMPPSLEVMRMAVWKATYRVRSEGSATVVAAALAADVGILVRGVRGDALRRPGRRLDRRVGRRRPLPHRIREPRRRSER